LTGPNFDGHDFIRQAFEKGAAATFVTGNKEDESRRFGDKKIFL
jgi:UDP-N-acetylmuramyl pentapeptide synthase